MSESGIIGKNIGQYQVVEQIGQGGMATVYRAYQPSINRNVAIKILPSQYAQDPNFVKRFEHEAKAIAALEHPHILPVYDFGTQEGLTYMVMRYVKGGTLSNLMGQSMPSDQVVRLVGSVARALDYAHKQGVVHRDIKPSNILIDKNGEALLTDFGIAKMMEGAGGATQLTGTGTVLGTPAYMSPEQAKGTGVDGRSDIYSLGVVLYELLTGQPPYQAETPLAVVFKHVSEPLPLPRSINPNVPEPLERVVIKAMAKDPNQRYQTAGEVEQALQAALKEIESGQRTVNVQVGPSTQGLTGMTPQPPKSGSKTGLWFIGGGVAVLFLCVLGSGLILFRIASSRNEKLPPSEATGKPVSIGIEKTATPLPLATTEPWPSPTEEPSLTEEPKGETIADILKAEGDILFQEQFDNNENGWPVEVNEDEYGVTNSEIKDGRYRISQKALKSVFSWNNLSQTDFDNFVLSVEATPVEHNAVFGYGLTFREDTTTGNLYVFEINTDGKYSVSLRKNGEWETLAKWAKSAAINKNNSNELMVKAVGSSLGFFVNGEEVTTLEDNNLKSGSIGLALDIIKAGDEATAEFDAITLRELTPEEETTLGGASSQVLFEDAFDSDMNGWATGEFEDDYSKHEVIIADGKYTLKVEDKDSAFVDKVLPNYEFADFILEVEATPQDTGEDYSYGVSFRENNEDNIFYAFEIGNDGQYAVVLYDDDWKRLKDWSTSKAIKVGETNKITISAEGKTLNFYVNDEKLTTVQNDRSLNGKVGLVVAMFTQGVKATVAFDNLVIKRP